MKYTKLGGEIAIGQLITNSKIHFQFCVHVVFHNDVLLCLKLELNDVLLFS